MKYYALSPEIHIKMKFLSFQSENEYTEACDVLERLENIIEEIKSMGLEVSQKGIPGVSSNFHAGVVATNNPDSDEENQ